MTSEKPSHVASEAFRILRSLYQLTTDLYASESSQDLNFRILNNTIQLFKYNRALLWSFDGEKPKLLGVSGHEDINAHTPLAKIWRELVGSIKDIETLHIVKRASAKHKDMWIGLARKTSGLSIMWVPIVEDGQLRAGLWLERWGDAKWDASECEIMNSISQNYNIAWKQFNPKPKWESRKALLKNRVFVSCFAVFFILFFFVLRISLRVVAPCEIIPKHPEVIAAPLDGVIKEVLVQPGQQVKKGDRLFYYEDRIIVQELKIAQKQVQIIKSNYDRVRLKAFQDAEAMEEVQGLQYRLEQEEIRLKLAESNAKHLEVKAPMDGVCMVDNPEYWKGRPVQIGERVVILFHPLKSKLKIFLPEKDNVRFNREKPVKIILNANPAKRYEARLTYVSPQITKNPQGGGAFIAEAELLSSDDRIKVGSKGSAIVFGEKVSVAYWLIRKPLAGVRFFMGI